VSAACPLCGGDDVAHFDLEYYRCVRCELTFLDPHLRPDAASERARYDEHRNDPDDAGYRAFLQQLAAPLCDRLPSGARGLDYGCGPGPTLSVMLEEMGYDVALYDPFYADNAATLLDSYDFITCTEVAEHFFNPGAEFERLAGLLRPAGILGVMTEPLTDDVDFQRWHYRRDPTHVCFYRPATMQWIAQRFGWAIDTPSRRVTLFSTPAST
jgi:SAM-dependent methyltransferase